MSSFRVSKMQSLFLGALILVAVAALAVRYGFRVPVVSQPANTIAQSAVPDFTSASFSDGDALAGLGADWTYLRQTPLTMNVASAMAGTSSTRESVIKAVGKETQLLLEESTIVDKTAFTSALHDASVVSTTVAGRDAYFVPTADIAGGTGLLLVGDATTLLIQDAHAATWPTTLEPEVLSYIATVRVP